jgi:hypothetical protein
LKEALPTIKRVLPTIATSKLQVLERFIAIEFVDELMKYWPSSSGVDCFRSISTAMIISSSTQS